MTAGKIKNLFNRKINLSEASYKALILASLYALLVFLIFTQHEFWRDELNTWLAVKNLDFAGILKYMAWDGHPFLHYFVLMFFEKTAGTPFSVQVFFWFFSSFSVFLFARFAPMPFLAKTIIAFSPAMVYYYPAFMRNYAYIPLLLFSVCIFWPGKTNQDDNSQSDTAGKGRFAFLCLLISMLAGTHAIMFAYSAGLLAVLAWDNVKFIKKRRMSILLPLSASFLVLLITAAQLFCASRINPAIYSARPANFEFIRIFSVFFTNSMSDFVPSIHVPVYLLYCGIAVVLLLILCSVCFLFKLNRRHSVIFSFSFLFQMYVYFFAYGAVFPVRIFSIPLMILSSYWIGFKENDANGKNIPSGRTAVFAAAMLFILSFP